MSEIYAVLEVSTRHGTEVHYLTEQLYKVGRGAECDIVIKDATASRVHICLFRSSTGEYRVIHGPLTERKSSLNGVYVNGKAVPLIHDFNPEDWDEVQVGQARPLRFGDNIRLSPCVLLRYRCPPSGELKVSRDEPTLSQ